MPAIVLTVVVAIASDKLRWRGPFILMFLPLTIAGYILLIAAKVCPLCFVSDKLSGYYDDIPSQDGYRAICSRQV